MKNNFEENISNEKVNTLPIARFDGEIVLIESQEQVEPACREILSHSVIGFDSETRPSFKAGQINKVSLLQLSTPTHCYLFRLNKIKMDKNITRILERKRIKKIGADVIGDIRALNQLRRFKAGGFIDLQNTIDQWGVAEKSVRKMSAIVLGHRVSKAQRLSNWEAAKLTPAQQIYAATDAWICVEIYDKLLQTEQNPLHPEPKPKRKKKKEKKSTDNSPRRILRKRTDKDKAKQEKQKESK